MSQSNTNLVWVDLEMTGLCPETCAIVEVAMIVTDRNLKVIDKPLNVAVWQPPEVLSRMEAPTLQCILRLARLNAADPRH